MFIKVRNINAKPGESDLCFDISKNAKIEEIKNRVFEEWQIEINQQRLLYKGKQLENDLRVFDYDVQLNDVIQLVVREAPIYNEKKPKISESSCLSTFNSIRKKGESKFFKIGDLVDAHDPEYLAWFEGTIVNIWEDNSSLHPELNEENVSFQVKLENLEHFADLEVEFQEIRLRSYYTYQKSELKEGMEVLVNYNIDEPDKRGFWYNCVLTTVAKNLVKGTLLVGKDRAPIDDCVIKFTNEIMRIEENVLLVDREGKKIVKTSPKKCGYRCTSCKDSKTKKCRDCGCKICGLKNHAELMILCDECDHGFHTTCLTPKLEEVPEDEWFCPTCKINDNEIVKAGEKVKFSKKKAKMASSKNKDNSRDWGRGMACVGRTKECTIVPKDHYGPIPGIEVGTCWKYRLQVSEAGVHRPHVAGIHGRESDGAYSLVLSGGYEDDLDLGHEFYYTGSGGRDLSGNKRVSGQSCDQKLTRMNKALALNCNAPFDDQKGAEAKYWRKGKPVRVVRNSKACKHSKFAPKEGNRYDGIYKVVKYYPEKGKSGFVVWKYLLRRDDPVPAPWEKAGKELEVLYPSDYLGNVENVEVGKGKRKKESQGESRDNVSPRKKQKFNTYCLETKIKKLIAKDEKNRKSWNECLEIVPEGKSKFLDKIQELFLCVCCQELVKNPVTTDCNHNICKDCLKRSFSAEIFTCPHCRFDLGRKYEIVVNNCLTMVLKSLFPGYSD